MHTFLLFKIDNQQEPSVQHRELCSMLQGRQDGRGIWGRMNTCMAESICSSPGTIEHCQSAILQNKIKKQKKNEQVLFCTLRDCSYFWYIGFFWASFSGRPSSSSNCSSGSTMTGRGVLTTKIVAS